MNSMMASVWQVTIELSLILIFILLARFIVKKTTKTYNSYLLWLSIPVGFIVAKIIQVTDFKDEISNGVGEFVQEYVSESSETLASASTSTSLWAVVWLSVTLLLLARLIYQHVQLRQQLNTISLSTDKAELWRNKLPARMSKYPIVIIDHTEFSPAVYGFIKPTIYFPQHLLESLTRKQIELIIQHEEHHIKQQHLGLNLIWDLLVCCLWFNPLVYVARQNFRHDQELFCDYLVLNNTTSDAYKSYGHALLSTVSATHSVSLLCSWNLFNHLEERIMSLKKSASITSKIALAVSGCLLAGCMSAYAASNRTNEEVIEKSIDEVHVSEIVTSDIHSGREHSETFSHEVHGNGNEKITWILNGDQFVIDNGDRYAVNADGSKRAMTQEESERFEVAYAEAKRSYEKAEELRIEHGSMKVLVEEELMAAQMELENAEKELIEAEHEIEMLKSIDHEEMVMAKKAMKKAREVLKQERARFKEEKKRAYKIIEEHSDIPPMPELPPKPPKK